MNQREYLTVGELVEYSRRSERYIRELIRQRELKFHRPSPHARILIKKSWWDEYVERKIEEASRVSERDQQLSKQAEKFIEDLLEKVG